MAGSTTDEGPSLDANTVVRAVELRWKHAIVAFLLGATTYALYGVAGKWTLDAAVFGMATLALILYSAVSFRGDIR
ncbi:hypothetical protein [Halosegnis sp.]|uniref:hypothetical protein n=1 Tax=Halosegnis sp. TaxID=2864959 RepID=UPI0035D4EF83